MHTMAELMGMSDYELSIEIAKLKGWKYQQIAPVGYNCSKYGNSGGWWVLPNGKDAICAHCQKESLPEITDIRTAYELEESVPNELRERYSDNLRAAVLFGESEIYYYFDIIHAPARIRCIAYILTMEGSA